MRKQIKLICPVCNREYNRDLSSFNRNIKLNRKSYCSLNCHAKETFETKIPKDLRNTFDISQFNKLRKPNPFKYYLKNIRNRKNKNSDNNLTLEELKEVWEKQNGICPYTKINLKLANHTISMKSKDDALYYASLDRIDSSLGYIKSNIEFISLGINFLKNSFTKDQVNKFLNTIATNLKE